MLKSSDTMSEISSLLYTCPACKEERLHRVLKAKIGKKNGVTIDATILCPCCNLIHHAFIKEKKALQIPVVLSDGASSKRVRIEFEADDVVSLEEPLIVEGVEAVIRGIELKDRRRVKSSKGEKIATIWTKKESERLRINVSINRKGRTVSAGINALPDEEFFVGDVLDIRGKRVAISAIKKKKGIIKRGNAQADEIVRIYGREIH